MRNTKKKHAAVRRRALALLLAFTALFAAACRADPAKEEGDPSGADTPRIRYRYAEKEEGQALMLSNDAFFDGLCENDLDYRMQKKGATLEEYKTYAADQIREFSKMDRRLIDRCFAQMEETLAARGVELPLPEEVVLIKTTAAEEGFASGYTHGTQIYLRDLYIMGLHSAGESQIRQMTETLWHELFHCMTHSSPEFREKMYGIIRFTVHPEEFTVPPSVLPRFVSNPDVEHHNATAVFRIGGQDVACWLAAVTAKPFEQPGDRMSNGMTAVLVPADGRDLSFALEEAENLYEVFGKNSRYLIDPEECLADNFSYAMLFGHEGRATPLPSQELLDEILTALTP